MVLFTLAASYLHLGFELLEPLCTELRKKNSNLLQLLCVGSWKTHEGGFSQKLLLRSSGNTFQMRTLNKLKKDVQLNCDNFSDEQIN